MILSDADRELLDGGEGEAAAFAMRLLLRVGEAVGAERFVPVTRAHVDGCLHHGAASLDFVRHVAARGGRVRVPTTLNVGSMDLIHPELFRGPPALARRPRADGAARGARLRSDLHLRALPDDLPPVFGEQIAWASRTRSCSRTR
jgi:predicted aconitase